jgi:hypothetical protein
MNESEVDGSLICKNCQHQISLHRPNCTTLLDDSHDDNNVCNCNIPEFYNVAISGKYIGWTEIHCNNCGKLVAYIDSSIENIEDFKIMCKNCIIHHY